MHTGTNAPSCVRPLRQVARPSRPSSAAADRAVAPPRPPVGPPTAAASAGIGGTAASAATRQRRSPPRTHMQKGGARGNAVTGSAGSTAAVCAPTPPGGQPKRHTPERGAVSRALRRFRVDGWAVNGRRILRASVSLQRASAAEALDGAGAAPSAQRQPVRRGAGRASEEWCSCTLMLTAKRSRRVNACDTLGCCQRH